jgi:hypothetical protein
VLRPIPIGGESRSQTRVALHAATASLLLIGGFVATMGLRTGVQAPANGPPPAAPDPVVAFALLDAHDRSDFDEDPAYADALRAVRGLAPSTVAAPPLDHASVLADPSGNRARPVRARGVVIDFRSVRLPFPVEGEPDVFRGILIDTDGSRAVAFDLAGPPGTVVQRGKDVLDVEGVFYRTVSYVAENGEHREIPYVLAKSIRTVPLAEPWHGLPPVVTAVVGLGVGVAIVLFARARARSKEPPRTTVALREALRRRAAVAAAEATLRKPKD